MIKFKNYVIAVFFLLLITASSAIASPYRYFTRFNSESGLPNNTITACQPDSYGFLWVGTKDGLYRFDGHSFIIPGGIQESMTVSGMIGSICEDHDGVIWFSSSKGIGYYNIKTAEAGIIEHTAGMMTNQVVSDNGDSIWFIQTDIWTRGDEYNSVLYNYSKSTRELKAYQELKSDTYVREMIVDDKGNLWLIASDSGSLFEYSPSADRFNEITITIGGKENVKNLTHIAAGSSGNLLLSTEDGAVYSMNILSNSMEHIFTVPSKYAEIRSIVEREEGEYWIGTADGLYIITSEGADHVMNIAADVHSLSGNDTWCMKKDDKGNVWIGTFYNGLNLWLNNSSYYSILYENPSSQTIDGKFVRSLCPDDEGQIWVGTEDGGLSRIDQVERSVRTYPIRNASGERINIQGVAVKGRKVWLATFEDGIFVLDIDKGAVVRHYNSPSQNSAIRILHSGEVLIGSRSGLYKLDEDNDSFRYIPEYGKGFIHYIMDDSHGGLWIGNYGTGIMYSENLGSSPSIIRGAGRGTDLKSDYITSVFEDSRHRIWITTEGGGVSTIPLEAAEKGDFSFTTFDNGNGMTSNVTSALAEDEVGYIWVSTSRGLVQIDPDEMEVKEVFVKSNFILGEQYSYGASYTAKNGHIYFGTTQGIFGFYPGKIAGLMDNCPIYITEIVAEKENQNKHLHEPGKSTMLSDVIKIKSKDISSLKISFSSADIALPNTIIYNYTLSKKNKAYKGSTMENAVRFVDIDPGHYTFKINRMGEDIVSMASIRIFIRPPFYRSIFASIMYLLASLLAIVVIVSMIMERRNRAKAMQVEKLEDQKQKEIYKAKLNFFTNITHEIRTPLTLIKMPLDKLISKCDYTESSKNDLLTMQDNTNRLLMLTNQILDMRKMDKNETQLRFLTKDLCRIVRHTYDIFEQNAVDQNIAISIDLPESPVIIPVAEDVVDTVLSNLLSNAVKYGKDCIEVKLEQLEDKVRMRVNSNGKRIPAEKSEKIFELFYQLDDPDNDRVQKSNGTGLGLPYARSMAKLHNGDLFLDTEYPDWNSFVFDLPLKQDMHIEVEKNSEKEGIVKEDWDTNRHFILVVEDDAQMRNYISNELSDEYNIITAANGEDALKKMEGQRIDLVVSDIMMPVMDGCQLCNAIKSSTEHSHVPVLLLTAAIGLETRMETLQVGADGYIEKPFSMELLRANISSLFRNREIAFHQFVASPLTHYNSVTVSNVDQKYMDKLHDIIIKNMADHNLNVDMLAEMLNTSKSTLYRKVKSNTGLNINEYMRLCRLKQAAEMLSSQKYRINEVADLVGFSSPSYFATSFQKQFNISPSNFVKQLRGEE